MEDNVYMLTDGEICRRIGQKIRRLRLRQNLTQMTLARQAQISVSTLKKIESGEISSLDALMRVLRVLGELDVLSSLIREEELSPNEYLAYVESSKKKMRKRAGKNDQPSNIQEESVW